MVEMSRGGRESPIPDTKVIDITGGPRDWGYL